MRYYLIVAGKGKARRILEYYTKRELAILALNHYVLDHMIDARLIVTGIQPPFKAGPRCSACIVDSRCYNV